MINSVHKAMINCQTHYLGGTSTAPTWKGDLNFSKRGPKGDQILSEKGTFGNRKGDQNGTKWGPKNVYLLTETYYSLKKRSF